MQTYCIFGSTSAHDLAPGFRVEGVTAGAGNFYCCALHGHMNTLTSKCEVATCGQEKTSYDAFVNAQNTFRDCYAQYVPCNAAGRDSEDGRRARVSLHIR